MCLKDTKPTVGIIVQARMGSARLPGKILKEVADGKGILEYILGRIGTCRNADKIIVATTTSAKDDILERLLDDKGYSCFRGSEQDCLDRFYRACADFNIDIAVRITADCPFVVPDVIDEMISYYLRNSTEIDYLSNRQYTNFPEGLDTEIFHFAMLEEAARQATRQREREHINYYFLSREDRYRVRYYCHNLGADFSRFKLSVDTQEDLDNARALFVDYGLPLNFSLVELIASLRNRIG